MEKRDFGLECTLSTLAVGWRLAGGSGGSLAARWRLAGGSLAVRPVWSIVRSRSPVPYK